MLSTFTPNLYFNKMYSREMILNNICNQPPPLPSFFLFFHLLPINCPSPYRPVRQRPLPPPPHTNWFSIFNVLIFFFRLRPLDSKCCFSGFFFINILLFPFCLLGFLFLLAPLAFPTSISTFFPFALGLLF